MPGEERCLSFDLIGTLICCISFSQKRYSFHIHLIEKGIVSHTIITGLYISELSAKNRSLLVIVIGKRNNVLSLCLIHLYMKWYSRRFLSTDTTKALVHAFVTSRVDYCNSLLYGLPASHLNKVQRVLNAAARLVCRAPRYCRITPLLCELHWLPVRQRISFKILLFVFKAIHGFAPTYLRELVSIKRSGNYNLRSSSDGLLLATPSYRSRVTLGDRSFQVTAPALWNILPGEIRSITDLGIFKRHLKTHLFSEAFY